MSGRYPHLWRPARGMAAAPAAQCAGSNDPMVLSSLATATSGAAAAAANQTRSSIRGHSRSDGFHGNHDIDHGGLA